MEDDAYIVCQACCMNDTPGLVACQVAVADETVPETVHEDGRMFLCSDHLDMFYDLDMLIAFVNAGLQIS